MIGTFVNVGTIMAGSLIGGLVKKVLKEEYNNCLFVAMGLASVGLGMNSIVQNMPDSKYPVLFVASLALGSLIGTIIDIDGRVGRLTKRNAAVTGEKTGADKTAESKGILNEKKKGSLGEGIVTASLLYCIGTLSILGPVQSALYRGLYFSFHQCDPRPCYGDDICGNLRSGNDICGRNTVCMAGKYLRSYRTFGKFYNGYNDDRAFYSRRISDNELGTCNIEYKGLQNS